MNTLTAIEVLMGLLSQATAFGNLIRQARAENRDITDAELDGLALADDVARNNLNVVIAAARAKAGGS